MNQEQKNVDIPPAYIESISQVSEKRRQYKKYAIIASSAVLVVAMILTAILVGLYFFSETQKEIIKFAFTRGDNFKEEVTSDPNTNVVHYHVNSDKYELWAYNDFNRDIQVMKIQTDHGTNCFVTPLNRTIAEDPSKIVAPNGVYPKAPNTTYHLNYRATRQQISDTTFLCKQARDDCKGISTYWMYPTFGNSTDIARAMEKRQKRDLFFFFVVAFVSIVVLSSGSTDPPPVPPNPTPSHVVSIVAMASRSTAEVKVVAPREPPKPTPNHAVSIVAMASRSTAGVEVVVTTEQGLSQNFTFRGTEAQGSLHSVSPALDATLPAVDAPLPTAGVEVVVTTEQGLSQNFRFREAGAIFRSDLMMELQRPN